MTILKTAINEGIIGLCAAHSIDQTLASLNWKNQQHQIIGVQDEKVVVDEVNLFEKSYIRILRIYLQSGKY